MTMSKEVMQQQNAGTLTKNEGEHNQQQHQERSYSNAAVVAKAKKQQQAMDSGDPWSSGIDSDEETPPIAPMKATNDSNVLFYRFSSWRNKSVAQASAVLQSDALKNAQKSIAARAAEVADRGSFIVLPKSFARGVARTTATAAPPQSQESSDHDGSGTTADDIVIEEEGVGDGNEHHAAARHASQAPRAFTTDSGHGNNDDDDSDYVHATAPTHQDALADNTQEAVASSGFRGRYSSRDQSNNSTLENNALFSLPPIPNKSMLQRLVSSSTPAAQNNPMTGKESQTSLILKSPAASHMTSILSTLSSPHQYVMLLGNGMLGVNLKQTFSPNFGVYVDFVVPGGNAYKSGVIGIGDALVKVGTVDVTRGTIATVPAIIAGATPRPVVLVLKSVHEIEYRVDYVSVAIAMVHQIQEVGLKRRDLFGDISRIPDMDSNTIEAKEQTLVENLAILTNSSLLDAEERDEGSEHLLKNKNWKVQTHSYHRQNSNAMNPPIPSKRVRKTLAICATRRNNERASFAALAHEIQRDEQFRAVLREAFITCCVDPRRLSFFASHLSNEDAMDRKNYRPNIDDASSASLRLMLYLELLSYRDLYEMTPSSRRINHAKRIAHKFLLSSNANPMTNLEDASTIPPIFDMRSLFAEEVLNVLEEALNNKNVTRTVFEEIESNIEQSLTGMKFASFLISEECLRMRAYLRGVSPYMDTPLEELFRHVTICGNGQERNDDDAHAVSLLAKNHLLFIMLYLICHSEKDYPLTANGTQDFGKDSSSGSKRLMGSAGGISCALFIERELIGRIMPPAVEAITFLEKGNAESIGKGSMDELQANAACRSLVAAFEHLWEAFIAPGGGILDSISHSNETQEALDTVRRLVVQAVSPPKQLSNDEKGRFIVKALLENEIITQLHRLAQELLYDYAVDSHPKFRGHLFHEWMCGEVSKESHRKISENDDSSSSDDEVEQRRRGMPPLSKGCIARLLRQGELPGGVSRHRPQRSALDYQRFRKCITEAPVKDEKDRGETKSESTTMNNFETPSGSTGYLHNAECAIVFGTDDGMDSAGRMPNDGIETGGIIRRFVCVPLGDNGNGGTLTEESIPGTLESYANVSSLRERPFSKTWDESRVSDDGWEVSLVNFMMPNASSDDIMSHDSVLFGVSLVFRRTPDIDTGSVSTENKVTELVHLEDFDDGTNGLDDNGSVGSTAPCTLKKNDALEGLENRDDGETPVFKDDHPFSLAHDFYIDRRPPFTSPIYYPRTKTNDLDPTALPDGSTRSNRRIRVSAPAHEFNRRLQGIRWSDRVKLQKAENGSKSVSLGIALVSRQNVIPAMRETLSRLYDDYTRPDGAPMPKARICAPLIDIFGNFSHVGVEISALSSILEPYLKFSNSLWVDKPLSFQKDVFEAAAGASLVDSLPPVPLSLFFITALLEQKIVLSSSRRSILLSAAIAIRGLLQPLDWTHLFVPLVPSSLSRDLVQYPAPYILGIASEDLGSLELLKSFPDDVTLVDLDVGRVILAKNFSHDFGLLRDSDETAASARSLRSQVLYLAEALGSVLGAQLQSLSWRCDSPLTVLTPSKRSKKKSNARNVSMGHLSSDVCFSVWRRGFRDFVNEALSGTSSCCFWIEEDQGMDNNGRGECNILFDEDRFYHIKNLRAEGRYMPLLMGEKYFTSYDGVSTIDNNDNHHFVLSTDTSLSLSLDEFDLVLETLLRGQGMSTYISSRKRESTLFW